MVIFMNAGDMERLELSSDDWIDLTTAIEDGHEREVRGLRVIEYDIPAGCCGASFAEVNPLIPLSHRDEHAQTPAYKATPVHVRRSSAPPTRVA